MSDLAGDPYFAFDVNTSDVTSLGTVWHQMKTWLFNNYHNPKSKIKLIDRVELYFSNRSNGVLANHWAGFIACPPNVPVDCNSLRDLVENTNFKNSLPQCLGLWVFSPYLKRQLTECLGNLDVPIHCCQGFVTKPAEYLLNGFNMQQFAANEQPYLVFLGTDNSRFDRFYQLDTDYAKCLVVNSDQQDVSTVLSRRMSEHDVIYDSDRPIMIHRVKPARLSQILQRNIAILDFYDCGVSDVLIECILRATPVLINPVGAVTDHLGSDYPLYFDSLEELQTKISDHQLIQQAHQYLLGIDKTQFAVTSFERNFIAPDFHASVVKLNKSYFGLSKFNLQFQSKTKLKNVGCRSAHLIASEPNINTKSVSAYERGTAPVNNVPLVKTNAKTKRQIPLSASERDRRMANRKTSKEIGMAVNLKAKSKFAYT